MLVSYCPRSCASPPHSAHHVADPSTPNHAAAQRVLFRLERHTLAPYELPGNRLSRDMYGSLPLPWDFNISLPFFPTPSTFRRVEWDTDGLPSAPSGEYLSGEAWTTLDDLQRSLGTASMVKRWREDPRNRGEEDVVVSAMRELRLALGEGVHRIKTGSGTVLLLLKKDG